jgi:hypothetical protein
MKNLVLVVLFFPLFANAQKLDKETNTIIVHGHFSVEQVAKTLESLKYRVANDGFGELTTLMKFMQNHGELQINVSVRDSVVIITGIFEHRIITANLFHNKESYGGHDISDSINFLIDFANALKGYSIEFVTDKNLSLY